MRNPLTLLLAAGLLSAATAVAEVGSPETALHSRVEQVMAFVERRPPPTPTESLAFLRRVVAPFVDFARMAEGIAGPMARDLSASERERLIAALRRHMLGALARGLAGYGGGEVRYLPRQGGPSGEGAVRLGLDLLNTGGLPLRLHFSLHAGPAGWRITDVSANGVSAVAFYRAAFRELVSRYGFEGALDRLG